VGKSFTLIYLWVYNDKIKTYLIGLVIFFIMLLIILLVIKDMTNNQGKYYVTNFLSNNW